MNSIIRDRITFHVAYTVRYNSTRPSRFNDVAALAFTAAFLSR